MILVLFYVCVYTMKNGRVEVAGGRTSYYRVHSGENHLQSFCSTQLRFILNCYCCYGVELYLLPTFECVLTVMRSMFLELIT